MHGVARHHCIRFIEVIAAGVEIPGKPGEVASRDFDAHPMPGLSGF